MAKWEFEPEDLNSNLKDIEKYLRRIGSYRHRFLMGIVNGFGVAIGATIVAGVFFTIASVTIDKAEDIPIIGEWIERSDVKDVVDTQDATP
jgi:uncharacterized membrane protein YciS (DUF1049 family)